MWNNIKETWSGLKRSVQLFLMGVGVIIVIMIISNIF